MSLEIKTNPDELREKFNSSLVEKKGNPNVNRVEVVADYYYLLVFFSSLLYAFSQVNFDYPQAEVFENAQSKEFWLAILAIPTFATTFAISKITLILIAEAFEEAKVRLKNLV